MNINIKCLNTWYEDELQILMSRLFHSVITAGKKEFLEKLVLTLNERI